MKTERGILYAAMLTTVLLVSGGPAEASHAVTVFGPEAEDRTRDAGLCAPDGESVREFNGLLELPNDGCWAEYDNIWVAGATPLQVRFAPPSGPGECGRLVVNVVYSAVHVGVASANGATGTFCGNGSFVCASTGVTLLPGESRIRVTFDVTAGPGWANTYLDYLSFGPAGLCQ